MSDLFYEDDLAAHKATANALTRRWWNGRMFVEVVIIRREGDWHAVIQLSTGQHLWVHSRELQQ